MAFYGISDFSLISSNLSTSSSGTDGIYGLISDYSETRAIRSAITTLNSSALSAKDSTEATNISDRLTTITDSIQTQVDGLSTTMTTSSGSSTITDLAKEQGQKLYEEYTGNGKIINTTV